MTLIWSGLAVGGIYALVALTFNITLASTGIFNFAQGATVTAGTFVAYVGSAQQGWPVPLTLVVALVVGAGLGLLVETFAIRLLADGRGPEHLVTTVGAGVAIEGILYAVYGTQSHLVPFAVGSGPLTVLGGRLRPVDLALLITAVLLTVIVAAVQSRSRWGIAGRAVAADPDAAAIRGVNADRVSRASFMIAGALGCAAGLVIAPKVSATYNLATSFVLFAFAAVTIGGAGNYLGGLAAGLALGLVQVEAERWLPLGASLPIVFLILLAVLLVRPAGLLGQIAERNV